MAMNTKTRQPNRPHFVVEWAVLRGYENQTQLATALGADKSVVSRWYNGTSPTKEYQEKLAELFHCEPGAIFRHPDEDWIVRFFHNRERAEIDRMKQMLELAFPMRNGTSG